MTTPSVERGGQFDRRADTFPPEIGVEFAVVVAGEDV